MHKLCNYLSANVSLGSAGLSVIPVSCLWLISVPCSVLCSVHGSACSPAARCQGLICCRVPFMTLATGLQLSEAGCVGLSGGEALRYCCSKMRSVCQEHVHAHTSSHTYASTLVFINPLSQACVHIHRHTHTFTVAVTNSLSHKHTHTHSSTHTFSSYIFIPAQIHNITNTSPCKRTPTHRLATAESLKAWGRITIDGCREHCVQSGKQHYNCNKMLYLLHVMHFIYS